MESWNFGGTWSADDISSALESHERGDFSESAKLAQAMGRDDRISACRNTRIRALTGRGGANFNLVASEEGDQRRAGNVRDRVDKQFFKVAPEQTLARVQGDVIDLGPSVSRIHWYQENGTGQWLPHLEPWSMEWIRRDAAKDCYVAQTADHGEVEVRGGTGEWLVVEPSGARAEMAGAVRALAMPWFFRGNSWKDWARYCEKHGVPILAVQEPPAQAGDPVSKTSKDRFYAALRRVGREGILRLPQRADGKGGYGAQFLEPKSLSWPSFEAFLTRLDICIAVYLLGQNLSTEVSGGSFAAAIAANRIRLDYLAADAEVMSTALRTQVWMPWGRFNFDWWDDALAPWPTWTTSVPEDLKAKAETLKALSDSLAGFKDAGLPIDFRVIGEQFGIPLLSLQDAEKAAADAAKKAAEAPKTADADDNEDTTDGK